LYLLFSYGELNDTNIENFFSSLESLDKRLEALGIIEADGIMTYLNDEEVHNV